MNKDKEPLLSAEQFYKGVLINLSTAELMKAYAKYHTEWHLNKAKEVVAEYYTCHICGGDGYTIEVEATCCMRQGNECCGIPDPIQVQRECFCDKGIIPFDKQSITNAIENYIKEKL